MILPYQVPFTFVLTRCFAYVALSLFLKYLNVLYMKFCVNNKMENDDYLYLNWEEGSPKKIWGENNAKFLNVSYKHIGRGQSSELEVFVCLKGK